MSDTAPSLVVRREGDHARVVLDRAAKRNAFDDRLAAELERAFVDLAGEDGVRAVVLEGAGPVFCAGGDLAWMRRVADYGPDENLADAEAFQRAYDAIDRCPHVVLARVTGAALGGGAGLVAVADVAIAAEGTRLGFPEVRLGLVPGVVAPYVLRRIGAGAARRLFVTGRVLEAEEALRLGLVDRVVPAARLDEAVAEALGEVRQTSPDAVAAREAR